MTEATGFELTVLILSVYHIYLYLPLRFSQ